MPNPEPRLPGAYPDDKHVHSDGEGFVEVEKDKGSRTDEGLRRIAQDRIRRRRRRSDRRKSSSAGHGITGTTPTSSRPFIRSHAHSARLSSDHDATRFSAYREAVEEIGSCFIGPLASLAKDNVIGPDLADQAIRFRVREPIEGDVDGEQEMIITSSPGNIPWILETLAPAGSGRHAVIFATNPEGLLLCGDLGLLAKTVPEGWPFQVVIEKD